MTTWRIRLAIGCAAALALVLAGCTSQGPAVPKPPTVSVSELRSVSFTPEQIKFEAKVRIVNNLNRDITFDRTDYAADLFDNQLFSETFTDMLTTHAGKGQTVTFPFLVSMDDVEKQGVDILSEEGLRVAFHGRVVCAASYGFDPIPFEATLTIPIPKVPAVTFLGVEGVPYTETFRIRLGVANPNSFPFTVDSIDSYLVLNDTRYALLRTDKATEIPAGGSGMVVLQMRTSPGKALSMALNLAQSGNAGPDLDLTGSVTLATPYGVVYVPVSLKQALNN